MLHSLCILLTLYSTECPKTCSCLKSGNCKLFGYTLYNHSAFHENVSLSEWALDLKHPVIFLILFPVRSFTCNKMHSISIRVYQSYLMVDMSSWHLSTMVNCGRKQGMVIIHDIQICIMNNVL